MATITVEYNTLTGNAQIIGDTSATPGTDGQKRAFLRKGGFHFPVGGSNMGTWNDGGFYDNRKRLKDAFELVFTSDTLVLTKRTT